MKEELVSFETAKLAKEKGFDEASKDFYYLGHLNDWKEGEESKNSDRIFDKNSCSAPTQSLLQKWLRDQHSLHVDIRRNSRSHPMWFFYIHELKEPYHTKLNDGVYYSSYEIALEVGLLESLRMIK